MKFQVNKRAVGRGAMLLGLGLVAVAMTATPALASSSGGSTGGSVDFGTMLTNLLNFLNGTPARMIGALAIFGTGITWALGHIDMKRAGTVIAGIGLMFGASAILGMLTGSSS